MADAEDEPGEAVLLQQAELMGEERLARDLDQQLRNLFGDRAQALGQAAGEDGDGKIGRHRESGKAEKREGGKRRAMAEDLPTFCLAVDGGEDREQFARLAGELPGLGLPAQTAPATDFEPIIRFGRFFLGQSSLVNEIIL